MSTSASFWIQLSEVAWKAVPDFSLYNFHDVLPSRQYIESDIVIPAHPRYTRMYGVTISIALQAIPHFRNLNHKLKICTQLSYTEISLHFSQTN